MNILNLIISGLILYGASRLFPTVVQFDSLGALVLATILIYIIASIVDLLCIAVAFVGASFGQWIWFLVVLLTIVSPVVAVMVLSGHLGFTVVGFWPKVLLSVCLMMCQLGTSNKRTNINISRG